MRFATRTTLRPFPPVSAGRCPARIMPIARTSRRECRPLIGPLRVARCAPHMDGFLARIHPQKLNCGGVIAAKNDVSGVPCGEIAIGPPVPRWEDLPVLFRLLPLAGKEKRGWRWAEPLSSRARSRDLSALVPSILPTVDPAASRHGPPGGDGERDDHGRRRRPLDPRSYAATETEGSRLDRAGLHDWQSEMVRIW